MLLAAATTLTAQADKEIKLCVVINVLTYVNQNRNHLAVLDFST